MELVEQIRKKFASLEDDNASLLDNFEEQFSSWAIKLRGSYAVGMEIDSDIKINESFANVSFHTNSYLIDGENKHLLLLSSNDGSLRNEFAGICALFLEVGPNGQKRKQLISDPIKWWLDWKNLIGNKSVETTIHGALGELVVLYYIKKYRDSKINSDNWTGPEGKSLDIRTKNNNYEVKTTLIKYNNIVTISGQYQLETHNSMSLMLVKMEDPGVNSNGVNIISIDSMVNKLASLGLDKDRLSRKVSSLGFKENSLDRQKTFRLLKLVEYPINEEFPLIRNNSLVNVPNEDLILQLTYKINLNGLTCRDLDVIIE